MSMLNYSKKKFQNMNNNSGDMSQYRVGRPHILKEDIVRNNHFYASRGTVVIVIPKPEKEDEKEDHIYVRTPFNEVLYVLSSHLDLDADFKFKCLFCEGPAMDTLNQLSNHIWKAHISDANVDYYEGFLECFRNRLKTDDRTFSCCFCKKNLEQRETERDLLMHILHVHLKKFALKYFNNPIASSDKDKKVFPCPYKFHDGQECQFMGRTALDTAKHFWLDELLHERSRWSHGSNFIVVTALTFVSIVKSHNLKRKVIPTQNWPAKCVKMEPIEPPMEHVYYQDNQKQALEESLDKAQESIQSLKAENKSLAALNCSLKHQKQELDGRVQDMDKTIGRLQAEVASLKSDKNEVMGNLHTAQENLRAKAEESRKSGEIIAKLELKLKEATVQHENEVKGKEAKILQIQQLRKLGISLKLAVEEKTKEISGVTEENRKLSDAIGKLRSDQQETNKAHETALDEKQVEIQRLEDNAGNLKTMLEEAQQKVNDVQAEKQDAITKAENEFKALKSDLEKTKDLLEKANAVKQEIADKSGPSRDSEVIASENLQHPTDDDFVDKLTSRLHFKNEDNRLLRVENQKLKLEIERLQGENAKLESSSLGISSVPEVEVKEEPKPDTNEDSQEV